MAFPFLALAIAAGFTILGQLLAPRPKSRATSFADFQVPTATEDRPKPYWVGTVRHKSPNCIWYGDYSTKAIKKGGGFITFGMSTIVGYKYNVGFQLSLGWGQLDALTRVIIDDKEAWSGSIQTGTITIDKPKLFGGENEGSNNGGFQGRLVVYDGNGTQSADSYVVAKSGDTPAYKKDVLIVGKGLGTGGAYIGNSASLPSISFDIRRCPNQLAVSGGKHIIDTHDANPVCALYEFMTREQSEFGGGFSELQFNLTNWRSAAEVLHAEGIGMSRMFDSSSDVETVINEYLNLIDGVINVNMTTGKFELALARDDYDPETIPVFDEDNIVEITSFKHGSWVDTYNEVRLSYVDRTQEFETLPIAAQDIANAAGQGEVRYTNVQIHGPSNPITAGKINFRELRVVSVPLATMSFKVNRAGFQLAGGSVFKWVGARHGVQGMVFRVTNVDYGKLDSAVIEVQASQDVFSLGDTAYDPPETSTWTPVSADPSPVTVQAIYEQPYFFHQTAENRVMTVAAPANGAQNSYDLYTKLAAATYGSVKVSEVAFTPTGVLADDYTSTPYNTSDELVITPGPGMDGLPDAIDPADIAQGRGLLMINNEILAYESYDIVGDDYIFNGVWGGLLDTATDSHTTGNRVWFISEACGLDLTNFAPSSSVKAKLASSAGTGTVALGDCTEITL